MKEDQEFKHACKFCSKSFPCGRSLGGHMRSHLTNNNSPETEDAVAKRKLSFVSNGGNDNNNNNTSSVTCSEAGAQSVYVLRENPKKTWRLAVSSEDTSLHDKLCKECGKGFLSWKALFGHMKCHSEKERVSNPSLEEQDSWASANQKPVMDSQSDNETAQPNRRRRSKRRTRFIGTANSCSFSLPNNGSSSVSETEQEQEELAMCLMMLSRDVTNRGGLNSIAESSDNNSVLLGAKFEVKSHGDDTQKSKKLKEKLESSTVDSASGISRTESKLDKNQVSSDGLFMNDNRSKPPLENQLGFDKFGAELWKNLTKDNGFDQAPSCSSKFNSSKKSLRDPNSVSGSEFCKDSQKRSKFECTTCNKIFNSYQALGGHRASHKKIKGCFASRVESSENSIETELSPDLTADSKLIKSSKNEVHTDQLDDKPQMKKTKAHECPICLKIFPSGQALGGHKRSHLVAGSTTSESKTSQAMVTEKPILEIRDLLDLNLPAPVEEDTNTRVGFKPWWVGSSHKQEGIVGLIRN